MRRPALFAGLIGAALLAVAPAAWPAPLRFVIDEGSSRNAFFQDGPVAAHINLTAQPRLRLLTAFPAGDSGVGLWFAPTRTPAQWGPVTELRAAEAPALHGVSALLTLRAGRLEVRQAVLGSVRSLRDYDDSAKLPPELAATAEVRGARVTWARPRLDGAPGYRLTLTALSGKVARTPDGRVAFIAPHDGRLRLRLVALTGDPPLTPIPRSELLTAAAAKDQRLADVLAFLTYDQKMLAGSWRFDTYFGRDTLLSVRLLSEALSPRATEAALAAVLARVNTDGEVAHEETIGDYAVLQHKAAGEPATDTPIYDYRPIDGAYLLAPVMAHYLLETTAGRARGAAFLDRPGVREALARNAAWVLRQAAPFGAHPEAKSLIALKPDALVGEWRDSLEGLGGGRYPYDVDAVLVPAALDSIARLAKAGLLADPDHALAVKAEALAKVWTSKAPPLFDVSLPAPDAAAEAGAYAEALKVDPAPAVTAFGGAGPLRFHALALDAGGRPIPVLHSDEGFALLFLDPSPEALEQAVTAAMRPFPAGLMTPVGMVVADPAFADPALQPRFGPDHYHGAVVWSWQQALFIAGLERQLQRGDLPASTRTILAAARDRLWRVVEAARSERNAELWSWSYRNHRYRIEPFGQRGSDRTESDAAQLWSTVYLGVNKPQR
ncbi:hypothetical protein [Phenylobacterium montanum]|uniref:Uncharacterized protein n=1 Tax=Phenylobacterium montanum TaxID=2823693 RepID=A0A975FZ90_9CAUL|nr:hypothetical protein [Caulobacter sp. S6]QUD87874.1 hypothetical protein KCG34_23000 [Caulobacter sp. S6]